MQQDKLTRQGNNIVDPAHNAGKDYVIIRAVIHMKATCAEASEDGMKQVYLTIPELPLSHAFGDKVPYPVRANNHVIYKAPKALLHKLAYKSNSEYGHYFVFDNAAAEKEHTKGEITNMREGVLTAPTG